MVIICNGFFPTYSDTSIISLLGNGLNSLFITRKNNKVRNDINITFINFYMNIYKFINKIYKYLMIILNFHRCIFLEVLDI